jgi:fibronectin type 3 domain-containing protein
LSGTGASGAASGSGQVTLTWDAPSTSPDPVAGYNVFRSPSGASSYQQLNSSAVTGTSYTDSTAQAGQSYNYVVLSVDASGVESGPSNVASAAL